MDAVPIAAAPVAQPERQLSLAEYDNGLAQIMRDVSRQGLAYYHFLEIHKHLQVIAQNPAGWDATEPSDRPRLPFINITFPTDGSTPGEYKLDLNGLCGEELSELAPLFMRAAAHTGELYMCAWEGVGRTWEGASSIVAAARAQKGS